MRILALDYGSARVGCALSDPSGTLVRPLSAIAPDPESAAALAREHEAELVLVGLPLNMNGSEGEQVRATRAFCAELESRLEVPLETYDERLTTQMAEASRRGGAEADEDSLAAAHLLEGYLAARGRARERDEP
jgi:putative Holliday junction resolvase